MKKRESIGKTFGVGNEDLIGNIWEDLHSADDLRGATHLFTNAPTNECTLSSTKLSIDIRESNIPVVPISD